MFSAKQLTADQIESLRKLAANGASLSDLQRHLKDEHGLAVTYMDIRLLVLDLAIELIEEKKQPEKKSDAQQLDNTTPKQSTDTVDVTMDKITLPGAMVSGKVSFSDGETAIWVIDANGRPGLDPDTPGYRPTQEDIMEFQTQLRSLLQNQGGL